MSLITERVLSHTRSWRQQHRIGRHKVRITRLSIQPSPSNLWDSPSRASLELVVVLSKETLFPYMCIWKKAQSCRLIIRRPCDDKLSLSGVQICKCHLVQPLSHPVSPSSPSEGHPICAQTLPWVRTSLAHRQLSH